MVRTRFRSKLEDTAKILEFLDKSERTRYRDLGALMSLRTLTQRLHNLSDSGLIEHHLEKLPLRKEWYELTERGRKALNLLRELAQTAGKEVFLFDQVHAKHILEFLDQKGRTQYKDMYAFICAPTLDRRLRALSALRLIEHHLERVPLRKEWYELTERGRKALKILREIDLILTE